MRLKTEIENTLKTELRQLFMLNANQVEFSITDIDGNITKETNVDTIKDSYMEKKIDTFATNFATKLAGEILRLKVDLQTASNPDGKLVINGANGGGAVVWSNTTQLLGALEDD